MLTPDQITAIAPDAASLKAGRDLASPRKWASLGGDGDVLWGLAMGSGKDPYQTRVALQDLATKCSCPSRKFPCKHALGLMFISANQAAMLVETERPAWVAEWMDARSARIEKAEAKKEETAAKPVDEKAAQKRRERRDERVKDGIDLLHQAILDMTRDGHATASVRGQATWENLARRMVDAQVPGLAGQLHYLADTVLRSPDAESEVPYEISRLHLLLSAYRNYEVLDSKTQSELNQQLGLRQSGDEAPPTDFQEDTWFTAGRRLTERDRLLTSSTWFFGLHSQRWARVLKFAHLPQTIAEPIPIGSSVEMKLDYFSGLYPQRANANEASNISLSLPGCVHETCVEELLNRFAEALALNPFLRVVPFLISLRPGANHRCLIDACGLALPWQCNAGEAMRVDAVCGGNPSAMCGEWDGQFLRLLAVQDGDVWLSLTPKPI